MFRKFECLLNSVNGHLRIKILFEIEPLFIKNFFLQYLRFTFGIFCLYFNKKNEINKSRGKKTQFSIRHFF